MPRHVAPNPGRRERTATAGARTKPPMSGGDGTDPPTVPGQ